MGKTVHKIVVDASGAVKGTNQAVKGLQKTSDEAKNAQRAAKQVGDANAKMSRVSSEAMGALSGVFERMGIPVRSFQQGIEGARKAQVAATGSSKTLRLALLALPFVAIAVAVLALVKAFTSTQEGADRVNRILVPLRTTLERLWGMVQVLSISMVDAFKDPQQAVRDLWEIIKSQIMNRITGIADTFKALSRVIGSALRLDGEGVREAAAEMGEAYLQALTGVEDVVGKVTSGFKNINAEMREAIEHGRRIQEIDEEIRKLKIAQAVPMARMRREYEEHRALSRDTTMSEEERLRHTQRSIDLARQLNAEQQKVLDLEIEQLELKQAQNDTSDEELLQLEQLRARREDIGAATERNVGRLIVREAQLLQAIDERGAKEEEEADKIQRIYLANLEERAEAFRHLAKTEDEIRAEDYAKQLADLMELREAEVVTEQEFADLKQAIWHDLYGRDLEAKREAERLKEEAALDRIRKEEDAEIKAQRARMEAGAAAVGEAIAQDIARAQSAEEATRLIVQSLLTEVMLRAFKNVFAALPFPLDAVVAPTAAYAAGRAARALVPGFARGGVVGDGVEIRRDNGDNRLITAKTGEMILTRQQQAMVGHNTLARAGVPGAGGGDMSGAIMSLKNDIRSMRFEIDLVQAVDKITDQQETNTRRRIEV
jgi:hypothetical protein